MAVILFRLGKVAGKGGFIKITVAYHRGDMSRISSVIIQRLCTHHAQMISTLGEMLRCHGSHSTCKQLETLEMFLAHAKYPFSKVIAACEQFQKVSFGIWLVHFIYLSDFI